MLDIVAGIFATALYAALLVVLIGFSPARPMTRAAALLAAAIWLAGVVSIAALGGLVPGTLGSIPANLLPFGGLLALLLAGWFVVLPLRNALLAIPLPALVAVNAGRLGGVFFLFLYFSGRLSAPFAPAAGIGDMITGALALVLAGFLLAGAPLRRGWLTLWNLFGAIDLAAAVVLGLLSAPGTPFRVFTEGPGTRAMTSLPWVLVPSMIVPIFILIHLVIATKLSSLAEDPRINAIVRPDREMTAYKAH